MQWDKGFSASYHASVVDRRTWRDTERLEIIDGSISRTGEGLRNSADITCVSYDRGEMWVRIWLDARQGNDSAHEALFTGLASAPDRDINGRRSTNKIKCFSVLQPCEDILLPRGWYAPAGARSGAVIEDLLSVTPAPVEIEGETPALTESIVAEDGENHLTMTEKVLTAAGLRMQIRGDGIIAIRPHPEEPSAVLDTVSNDIVETSLTDSYDWYQAPNVFRAITDTKTVIFRDTSDSPLSVTNRGREIWLEETNCKLIDSESLESYAERRLREEQQINRRVSYTRRYLPDIYPTDILELRFPLQGITGSFAVRTQSIKIGQGSPVSEEVKGL